MNVIIRKRQIIMSALVLALGSAVFVNWYFTKPEAAKVQNTDETATGVSYSTVGDAQYVNAPGQTAAEQDFMSESRLARDKAHDEAYEKLNDVIKDSSASQAAVEAATKQLAELTNMIKLEADVEALVAAKCGFKCIVLINSGIAEIACEKGTLNSTSILQIKEILLNHTNINAENITIFEIK